MIAGIDGCKGGWLVVKSKDWPCRQKPYLAVCERIVSALDFTKDCDCVLIDIPIGIPSGGHVRGCDLEAKRLLKPFASSVFLTPPRETLSAKNPKEFQSVHRRCRRKGAGIPVWGFLPKLKEVDQAITPELQDRILEFHPELAWKRVSGGLLASKHTENGLAQRASILRQKVPEFGDLLQSKKKLGSAVKIDDILDALIGLSVAEDFRNRRAFKVPEGKAETDERGLRMEIWY